MKAYEVTFRVWANDEAEAIAMAGDEPGEAINVQVSDDQDPPEWYLQSRVQT